VVEWLINQRFEGHLCPRCEGTESVPWWRGHSWPSKCWFTRHSTTYRGCMSQNTLLNSVATTTLNYIWH